MYDDEQFESYDTCSEMNYNTNFNYDGSNFDSYAYMEQNQWQQNGEFTYDGGTGKKTLPQPPLSYSQSVNDGFGGQNLR